VNQSNAGDCVLFGAYDGYDIVSFDDQVGAHGAMGGRQFWPFLMTPPGKLAPDYEINDPLDLYPVFMKYRNVGIRKQ